MTSKNNPILVVGGNGYIGSALVEKLLKKKYRVRVFDKFLYGKNILKDLESNKKLEIIEGDISNISQLIPAMKDVQAVVHLAGIVGDAASSIDEKLTHHVNIISTRILRDASKAFQIPKFVFASSCSVYGITQKVSSETSSVFPISIYAKTKLESEDDLLSDTSKDFHPTILRLATVFGHSRKPRFDLVGNLFTAKAFNDEPLTVANGEQWRPFLHVSDIANAIIAVLEAPNEKTSRQIFNVGDERNHLQIGQLAELVKDVFKGYKDVEIVTKEQADDKRDYRVSFKKIRNTLNFTASVDMRKGIEEIMRHFKDGTYKKPYNDPYYSNLEMTILFQKEFYTEAYRKSNLTEF